MVLVLRGWGGGVGVGGNMVVDGWWFLWDETHPPLPSGGSVGN